MDILAEINTKYFGKFFYKEDECITFPHGLFGFENYHDYILIPFTEGEDSTFCLQSIKDETLAFIIINPFLYIPEYTPVVSENDKKIVEIQNENDLSFYIICVMRDTIEESTANLKCPIVVNPHNRLAHQIILEDSNYGFRHSFQSFAANTTKE